MEPINVIIIDDEVAGRENLKFLIENYCPELKVLGLADSAASGKQLVLKLKPDAVFLDIKMPVLDGFDFLDSFSERDFKAVIVTSHGEFGIKAVKANAVDYLLKPVDIKELQHCVKKLLNTVKQNAYLKPGSGGEQKLIIPNRTGFEFLETDIITRLEADDSYTKIFLESGRHIVVSKTLKQFEEALPGDLFYRIHKSHIINLNFMREYTKIDGGYAIMFDGSKVGVSRRKAAEFLHKIKKLNLGK